MITHLKPNQVFVFGSNGDGFHGAGAAGLAWRGTTENTWRSDNKFVSAWDSRNYKPLDQRGKWAVLGVARGFQEGTEGKSYAIQTCVHAGQRRSVSLLEIKEQLVQLMEFAKEHPEWEFLLTPIGTGLAGYTREEIKTILNEITIVDNVKLTGWEDER